MSMTRSFIAAWASILNCNHAVVSATSSNLSSCVAWMCCGMSNSIKHAWACPDLSLQRWHRFLIAIMLLLVLRHPTCASCVALMCCRMSNSMKLVWACLDLSFHRLRLYTFLHCLRSNFSPSRPLHLWIEAACEASLARDKYAMQSTKKAVEGATALFVCKSRRLIVILLIFLSVSSVCLSRRHVILYRKTYALLRTMVQGRRREACFSDFSLDFV